MIIPLSEELFDKNVKVNVDMKDGSSYLGKDIPNNFPDMMTAGVASFWNEGSLAFIPLADTKVVTLTFED